MLAKLTYKNQITLPKAVLSSCQGTEYFDVTEDNGRIVLTPVRLNKADAVRSKLADMGIGEDDVTDAVNWVREGARKGAQKGARKGAQKGAQKGNRKAG